MSPSILQCVLYALAGIAVFGIIGAAALGIVALIIRFHPRILGPVDAEVKLAQIRHLCDQRPMDPDLRSELLEIIRAS